MSTITNTSVHLPRLFNFPRMISSCLGVFPTSFLYWGNKYRMKGGDRPFGASSGVAEATSRLPVSYYPAINLQVTTVLGYCLRDIFVIVSSSAPSCAVSLLNPLLLPFLPHPHPSPVSRCQEYKSLLPSLQKRLSPRRIHNPKALIKTRAKPMASPPTGPRPCHR